MTKQKLIEAILEIGILARGINDLELDEDDASKLGRIERLCEDIEVEWKVEQANDRLQSEVVRHEFTRIYPPRAKNLVS